MNRRNRRTLGRGGRRGPDRGRSAPRLFLVLAALAGFAAAPRSASAQPNELVGFHLGQSISELKKTYGSTMLLLRRGRLDQALSSCGMDTYEIERAGERLEITSVNGTIAKLDLSKDLEFVDPIAMAKGFAASYGPPRQPACKLLDGPLVVKTVPADCSPKQTYVQLDYWRGASPEALTALRIRLRAQATGYGKATSRVTLSRGWDARVQKLTACSDILAQDLRHGEVDATPSNIPEGLRRPSYWVDPDLDSDWVLIYRVTYYYY